MHEVDMTKCLVLSMNEWRQQHEPAVPVVSQVHLQVGNFTCVEPAFAVTAPIPPVLIRPTNRLVAVILWKTL
jgi:hypothetical protein